MSNIAQKQEEIAIEEDSLFDDPLTLLDEDLYEIMMLFENSALSNTINKADGLWKDRGKNLGLAGFEVIDHSVMELY